MKHKDYVRSKKQQQQQQPPPLPSLPHVKNQFKEKKRKNEEREKTTSYPIVIRKCNSHDDVEQLNGNWLKKKQRSVVLI